MASVNKVILIGNVGRDPEIRDKTYRFLSEQVARLNDLNPQVAARLLGSLSGWRRYDGRRRELMKEQLEKVLALPDLAKDVYEIAVKSLNH